jgi:putative transposase
MPWKESSVMLERMKFIVAVKADEMSFRDQCQRFGISRKTGYKWLGRFDEGGCDGLKNQSRAPHYCPQRIDDEIAEMILQLKHRHPNWGPKKIAGKLEALDATHLWPASSTIGELLKRHHLVKPRKKVSRIPASSSPLLPCQAPNEVWSADFKGQFQMGNGQWLYPLTVTDNFSRFLLGCDGLLHTTEKATRDIFVRLFKEHGLPQAIRTDNGNPFATRALGGLARLSVWWIKLGIHPERIAPGKPQQNGRHERLHRTLNEEAIQPPSMNATEQQQRFDEFRYQFNHERPHEALDNNTPSSRYAKSRREMPDRLPEIAYPDDWPVRQVRSSGDIKWKSTLIFVSAALRGEPVGLKAIDEDRWQLFFAHYPLGILDGRRKMVIRP